MLLCVVVIRECLRPAREPHVESQTPAEAGQPLLSGLLAPLEKSVPFPENEEEQVRIWIPAVKEEDFESADFPSDHNPDGSWRDPAVALPEDAALPAAYFTRPDLARRVLPAFREHRVVTLDVRFRYISDPFFHLIDPPLNQSELLSVLRGVADVWAQAKIHVRVPLSDALAPHRALNRERALAYRWYVFGEVKGSTNETVLRAFFEDLPRYRVAWILRMNRVSNGLPLLRWILGSEERGGSLLVEDLLTDVDVYPLRYWRLYNGLSQRDGRVMIRTGICEPALSNRTSLFSHPCAGWEPQQRERQSRRPAVTAAELTRHLSHELGRLLGLRRPSYGCQRASAPDQLSLMKQPRLVALYGSKEGCSENNPVAFLARKLEEEDVYAARVRAVAVRERQLDDEASSRAAYHRNPMSDGS